MSVLSRPVPSSPDHHDNDDHDGDDDHTNHDEHDDHGDQEVGGYVRRLEVIHNEVRGCLISYKSQLLLLGKFEYGGGPIFKVVLEC